MKTNEFIDLNCQLLMASTGSNCEAVQLGIKPEITPIKIEMVRAKIMLEVVSAMPKSRKWFTR